MRTLKRRRGPAQKPRLARISGGVTVSSCSIPSRIEEGGSFSPDATIDNQEQSGLAVTVTWDPLGVSESVSLPTGTTTVPGPTVTYDEAVAAIGEGNTASVTVTVEGYGSADCGSLEVVPPDEDTGQASLSFESCRVSRNTITEGEDLVLEADVRNNGNAQGSTTVVWESGGTTIASRSVTVSANDSRRVTSGDITYDTLTSLFSAGTSISVQATGAGSINCGDVGIDQAPDYEPPAPESIQATACGAVDVTDQDPSTPGVTVSVQNLSISNPTDTNDVVIGVYIDGNLGDQIHQGGVLEGAVSQTQFVPRYGDTTIDVSLPFLEVQSGQHAVGFAAATVENEDRNPDIPDDLPGSPQVSCGQFDFPIGAPLTVTACRNLSVHREEGGTYRIPYNIDAYRAEGVPENVRLGLYLDGVLEGAADARIWDTGTNSYTAEFRGESAPAGTHEVGLALATAVHEMPDAPQATCGTFEFLEHEQCPPQIGFDSATINQIVQGNHECPPSSIIEVVNFASPGTITYDESEGELLKGITQAFFNLRLRNVSTQGIPVFDIPYIVDYEGIISGDPQTTQECINPYIGSTICEGPTSIGSDVRGRAVWDADTEMGTPLEFQVPSGAPSMTVTIFPGTDLEQSVTANVDSSGALAIIPRPEGAPEPDCTSNADCPDGTVCFEGDCVVEGSGGGCQGNQDCPEGEECAGGTCVPVEETGCTADSDCAENEVCVNGHCIPVEEPAPGCSSDADCSGNLICQNGSCVQPGTEPAPTPDEGLNLPLLAIGGLAAAGAGVYWYTQRENGNGRRRGGN